MNVHNPRTARSEHRRHDRLLVTRYAMDDAYPTERADAVRLVESCSECAALVSEIRLVASSVTRLPQPVRSKDFMITAEQAERLQGSRVSRWLRALSAPGWATLRPVAGVALSIGLVMAVVGAAMPRTEFRMTLQSGEGPTAGQGLEAPAPTPPLFDNAGAPHLPTSAESVGDPVLMAEASQDPLTGRVNSAYVEASSAPGSAIGEDAAALPTSADPTRDLLVYAGLAIATLSLGLLALAWAARRYFTDPLLR